MTAQRDRVDPRVAVPLRRAVVLPIELGLEREGVQVRAAAGDPPFVIGPQRGSESEETP